MPSLENSVALAALRRHSRIIGDIAFVLFFFAKLFSSWPPELHIVAITIQALSAAMLALLLVTVRDEGRSLLVLFGICLILTLHNLLFVKTESVEAFIQLCVAATAGCHLFFNGISKRVGRAIFWTTIIAICIFMAVSPDGYYLFPNTLSRNYASVFMLMAYVCLASSRENVPHLETLLSAMVCLLVSIFCVGRGGILATGLLALCCLVSFMRLLSPGTRRAALAILAVVGVFALTNLALVMGDEFLARFSVGGTVSASNANRLSMLEAYFNHALGHPLHLLLGFNPLDTGNSQILKHAGNVHNSFLQFHSCFGLIPLAGLLMTVWTCVGTARQQGKPYLAAGFAAFYARALLDWMFPLTYADYVVFLSACMLCGSVLSSRGLFAREPLKLVGKHFRALQRHAYAVCTPLQLFGAIEVRSQLLSERTVPADIFVSDEFKGAREAADALRESALFDRVFLVPPNFPTGRLPMVREYLKLVFLEKRCRQEFEARFPVGDTAYTEFFCANPRTIIALKWFAAARDARVSLLFEGMGSYAGTITGYFTIKNATVDPRFRSKLRKQVAKQDLKEILECLDTRGFFYEPARMFVIEDLPELHEMYPHMEIARMCINTEVIAGLGGYFSLANPELYTANRAFFLGTYDELVSSELQFDLAAKAARVLGCPVVFRAHPKNPAMATVDEGIVLDETGNLWELVCCNGLIARDAVLIGFASTAQFLPKQLLGQEPLVISLQRLMEPGVIRDRLELAAGLVENDYADKQRMLMPSTVAEYEAALVQIRTRWDAEGR